MKMPNNHQAQIATTKIDGYLLCDIHPEGKHKAAFFQRFGFDQLSPDIFRKSLIEHAVQREVIETVEVPFGTKYILECELPSPDQRNPCIKTVWIVKKGEAVPQLITAFPA